MLELKIRRLKPRQEQVLKLICLQFTNREIAEALGISTRTVDNHREVLLKKTNSKNTAGLVIFAIKTNIFDLNDQPIFKQPLPHENLALTAKINP